MIATAIKRLFGRTGSVRRVSTQTVNRFGFDHLEDRTVPALLGVIPTLPAITYNSTGHIAYVASAKTFDLTATPLAFKENASADVQSITGVRDMAIHIKVDNAGNLIGGVPGPDLVIQGDLDIDGNGSIDYSGVLLTGEIRQFGFEEAGTTDLFDFRFTATGGALAAFFTGKDIAVRTSAENSTFANSFCDNFESGAKGTVGPIDPLPCNPCHDRCDLDKKCDDKRDKDCGDRFNDRDCKDRDDRCDRDNRWDDKCDNNKDRDNRCDDRGGRKDNGNRSDFNWGGNDRDDKCDFRSGGQVRDDKCDFKFGGKDCDNRSRR